MHPSFLQRHGFTIALVVLAGVFYAIGYRKGSVIAIAVGVGLEIAFWVRIARGTRSESDPHAGARNRS